MKTLALILLILPFSAYCQESTKVGAESSASNPIPPEKGNDEKKNDDSKDEPNNRRISFIIGPGASYITGKLYENPVINQTNNTVVIDNASRIKTNLAVGIIYTPYISDIIRTVSYIDENGNLQRRKELESVPRGMTYAVFLNPLSFGKATEAQPFLTNVDFGIGYGFRFAGGLLIMAAAEYFTVRQPRQWFVDEFKTNDKSYVIGGAIQKSIDTNDNTIFRNKPVITFGFKACYSFDIIKNYVNTVK